MPVQEPKPARQSAPGFGELVFSDLVRYRTGVRPGWLRVLALCLSTPGMIASVIIRAQQCLYWSGHVRLASVMRTVSAVVLGADFSPGMTIGKGLMVVHPSGVTIGYNLKIGDNVTFAGGVTAAARYPDARTKGYTEPQQFATICDGATIGAHAVLVGDVRIGKDSLVGANSVVVTDVPDLTVVSGNPARKVGLRELVE